MSDPRLTNQQKYLTGATLTLKRWVQPRPGWDHDHCAFCAAKLAGQEFPDALHEGYVTGNGDHWVCAACFADFRSTFQWQIV